jgi:hypothetical protein
MPLIKMVARLDSRIGIAQNPGQGWIAFQADPNRAIDRDQCEHLPQHFIDAGIRPKRELLNRPGLFQTMLYQIVFIQHIPTIPEQKINKAQLS